jgi:putative endonuclease
MYSVYFLYSKKIKNVYVGCTNNIERRFKEHQLELVISTKNRRPFVLIYTEEYDNLSLARKREKYLKSLYGYRERKKITTECLKNKKP